MGRCGQVLTVDLCYTDELEPHSEQSTSSFFLSTDTVKLLHDALVCLREKKPPRLKCSGSVQLCLHTLGGIHSASLR